jgi:hypothetical protein
MGARRVVNEMADRIARAIGKDVSIKRGFRERAACVIERCVRMKQARESRSTLHDDATAKILSSFPHAPMERMTSLRVTFEIPFH